MDHKLQECVEKVLNLQIIRPEDIPNIDLYVDQILSIMDRHLADHKMDEDDKIMTKAMINNYSKRKIIKPIKGKTYSREQILQIMMIYVMKNALTMEQMKTLMEAMYLDEQFDESNFENAYQQYLNRMECCREPLKKAVLEWVQPTNETIEAKQDLLVDILCLCNLSEQLSRMAKALIEANFPQEVK